VGSRARGLAVLLGSWVRGHVGRRARGFAGARARGAPLRHELVPHGRRWSVLKVRCPHTACPRARATAWPSARPRYRVPTCQATLH